MGGWLSEYQPQGARKVPEIGQKWVFLKKKNTLLKKKILSPYKLTVPQCGNIVPKDQNFKNSNERDPSTRAALYSLLKTGRFELFLGWLPPKMGGRVGGVNVARKT